MARPKMEVPTPAETRALLFLHMNGPSTVREYLEQGGLAKEGRAYTTAMSLMIVLHKKGLASRTAEGNAFRYAAVHSLGELQAAALQEVLDTTFGGSLDDMKAAVGKLEAGGKRKK